MSRSRPSSWHSGHVHELALCRSIAAIADRNRGGRPVTRVGVRLGAFRQAVPETLTSCWSIVTEGTALNGSELSFEIVPLVIHCHSCEAESELSQVWLRCPACSSSDVTVVHGEEFMVTHLDVADG